MIIIFVEIAKTKILTIFRRTVSRNLRKIKMRMSGAKLIIANKDIKIITVKYVTVKIAIIWRLNVPLE